MSYLVIARKYRPQTFDDVVGQEAIAQTLKNAIATNRVAHAYLFSGPRGVGKTTMARILAKALNCKKGPTAEPCNDCEICKSIGNGDDVDVIEIDGASNRGIDQIRSLRDNVRYAPARSRHKIYIIDEVHMLTKESFNALLKTLEEPPPHVKFIFATTEPQKVIETIRSRCQRFDFRRIPAVKIVEQLAAICKTEKIKVADGVLAAIARSAHGGMRDAESLLDQLAAGAKEITLTDLEEMTGAVSPKTLVELFGAFAKGDARRAVEIVDDVLGRGAAQDELIEQVIEFCRELLILRVAGADTPLIDRTEEDKQPLRELADGFTTDALMFLVQMFSEAQERARKSSQSRIVLELALLKAAESHQLRPLQEILSRLRALELGMKSGGGTAPTRPSAAPRPATAASGSARQSVPTAATTSPAAKPAPAPTGALWTDVLAVLEQAKPPLAHMLTEAADLQPQEQSADGKYVLVMDDAISFAQASANQKMIQGALAQVTGGPCQVELQKKTTSAAASAPAAPKAAPAIQPKGEHVKKAMDRFGARVVATREAKSRPEPRTDASKTEES